MPDMFPPDPIAAHKAPGPPVDEDEHPDHHNELATAINDTTDYLVALQTATIDGGTPATVGA